MTGRPRSVDLGTLSRARELAASGRGRAIREAAGLRANEVAADPFVNVSSSTISLWERGLRVPRGRAAVGWVRLLDDLEADVVGRVERNSLDDVFAGDLA